MTRVNLCLVAVLLCGACSQEQAVEQPRPDPVVAYLAYEDADADAIRATLDRYTEETGVYVIDRRGTARSIVADLIENRVSPPADLLLTPTVVHAWHAAEESALRPLYSDRASAHLPAWAMDPDSLWFATAIDYAVIAYSGEKPFVAGLVDLGHDRFFEGLCLSSSTNGINRAVIARLLEDMPVRTAEIVVRNWIRNLAHAPFASEAELAQAIADEQCRVGILSRDVAVRTGLDMIEPQRRFADVATVGVGRHARNPEGAARLAEWLVLNAAIADDGLADAKNLSLVGWRYEDAVKLAERARYD